MTLPRTLVRESEVWGMSEAENARREKVFAEIGRCDVM